MAVWVKCVALILIVLCGESQGCNHRPKNTAPEIRCPRVSSIQRNDPGRSTATVRWSNPVVSDREDSRTTLVISRIGRPSGSVFSGGRTHTVKYTVKDRGGLTATCQFSFIVTVRRCAFINTVSPINGRSVCTGNRYGDVCRYSCNQGYTLTGRPVSSCTIWLRWDYPVPQCKIKTCGSLPSPPPNSATPAFVCSKGENFGSFCQLICDRARGYEAESYRFTTCTNAGTWSNRVFKCKDIQPPEFTNCPTQTLHQTSQPGTTKTSVVWQRIMAVDNSNRLQPIRASAGATVIGGQYEDGTHIVRFDVKDVAGNAAVPCMFIVKIERVECDPPNFDGEYIRTPLCIPPFEEGDSCKVECHLSIPLVGSRYITCRKSTDDNTAVGFWDWGQNDTPPKPKPFCQVATCPNLPAPAHGAVSCDEWTGGEICSILCDANYDVAGDFAPDNFKPSYTCLRNRGTWDQSYIPECSEPFFGDEITLEAAYIFNGPCAAAEDEIKNKFIQMLKDRGLCIDPNCKVENVDVVCGITKKKRAVDVMLGRQRRRANLNYIRFTLKKKNEANPSLSAKEITDKTVAELDQAMLDIRRKGTFVASGNVIKARTVRKRAPIPVCQNGQVRGRDSRTVCVPCPKGSFYNPKKQCQVCPVGQYQDVAGRSKCKMCPGGQSTLSVGSTSSAQCLAKCPLGQRSKSGLVSCTACPRGTYTTAPGSKQCTSCPAGTSTKEKGTDSVNKCTAYDMLLQGPVLVNSSIVASRSVCTMTFSVWAKVISDEGEGLRFEIYRQHEGVSFSLELKRVNTERKSSTGSTRSHLVVNVNDEWTHIAVVMTTQTSTMYRNGRQYQTSIRGSSSCPIPEQSTLRVNVAANSYVFVRDLNVQSSTDPSVVRSLSTTCSSNLNASVFALQHLNMRTMDQVLEVAPSSCLNDGACKTKPCGSHVCIVTSTDEQFQCLCRGGYSGKHCEVAPDYCIDNQCATGSTCISNTETGFFFCHCPPGVTGTLCDVKIADGVWSAWSEWSECSRSCSSGVTRRERVCKAPAGTSKPCPGSSTESKKCQITSCPVCRTDDLRLGQGANIKSCSGNSASMNCTIECERGRVYKEEAVQYSCTNGDWTPDRFTQSCTAPETPVSVGIKYCAVYQTASGTGYIHEHLQQIGERFQCVKRRRCRVTITVKNCDDRTPACVLHSGKIIGCVTLSRGVEPGPLDLGTLQLPSTMRPLLNTWEVFQHESTETFSPAYRPLELAVNGSDVLVYPHSNVQQAIRVSGKFGEILSTWNDLDKANWEVRKNGYTAFNIPTPGPGIRPGEEVPYLAVQQALDCPETTVQGGLFCVKCAPGTYYVESTCQPCPIGFYQNEEGQLECKSCPGASSTYILGASTISMCENTAGDYS